MTEKLKDFIERYIDLIENNQFEILYDIAKAELRHNLTGELTSKLFEAEIYPHEHMDKIPEYYLHHQAIDNIDEILKNKIEIGGAAFTWCVNITKVDIPEGCKLIDHGCFLSCLNLEEVKLPKSLEEINGSIFTGCKKLNTLIYAGTKDEFKNIDKAPAWKRDSKINKIVCVDGDINYPHSK